MVYRANIKIIFCIIYITNLKKAHSSVLMPLISVVDKRWISMRRFYKAKPSNLTVTRLHKKNYSSPIILL